MWRAEGGWDGGRGAQATAGGGGGSGDGRGGGEVQLGGGGGGRRVINQVLLGASVAQAVGQFGLHRRRVQVFHLQHLHVDDVRRLGGR